MTGSFDVSCKKFQVYKLLFIPLLINNTALPGGVYNSTMFCKAERPYTLDFSRRS